MLLNRTRAWEIMDRHGLDALVAQLSINTYYFSDYWGSLNWPGFFDGTYFAVLPRREDAPAALVIPSFEIRRLASEGATWDEIENVFMAELALLRPGTRYSDLVREVTAAIRGAGFPEYRGCVVHSLGLEHTDDPKPVGAQPGLKPDAVLEPGMVVNVDMPFTEIGWGSVHIEDTVVITAGGCDPLTSLDLRLQVVE